MQRKGGCGTPQCCMEGGYILTRHSPMNIGRGLMYCKWRRNDKETARREKQNARKKTTNSVGFSGSQEVDLDAEHWQTNYTNVQNCHSCGHAHHIKVTIRNDEANHFTKLFYPPTWIDQKNQCVHAEHMMAICGKCSTRVQHYVWIGIEWAA